MTDDTSHTHATGSVRFAAVAIMVYGEEFATTSTGFVGGAYKAHTTLAA